MPLRFRIALGFAAVAIATAAMIAGASPQIVGQGLSELESELDAASAAPLRSGVVVSQTPGAATETEIANASDAEQPGEDERAEAAAAVREAEAREQVEQGTVARIVLAGIAAALIASLLGLFVAGRLTRPLRRLESAAEAVARGDLSRRSGLGGRGDEFGQLGRSFDSMASELERAEDNRRRFLQDAVHELRTPLTVIDATASAIIDGVYAPDRAHLETIREQSRLLSRIVDDLRTISLAEVGQLPLRIERIELDRWVAAAARGFVAPATEKGVRLAVEAAPGLAVSADPDRLRQIVAALVDNAIRHSPPGGTVSVVAAAAEGEPRARSRSVWIGVEDEGPGIPEDALPRLFDRFYQGDPDPARPKGTSGLGLSIVQALVQAHGGRVGAENVHPHGARIWFELPAAEAPSFAEPSNLG